MNKKRKTYEIQESGSELSKVAEAASSYLLYAEFLSAPEADFETMTALENLLQRAQDFSLAFARVNIPTERNRLVAQIRQRFESRGIKIFEINLPTSTTDLLAEILDQLKKQNFFRLEAPKSDRYHRDGTRQRIVFVYGIEHSILSSETYHPTLAVLNYKRELFREKIPVPVIFWLPEYALQAIAEGAADFWAWRSGVFEFATPRQESEKMWLAEQPKGDDIALSRLTKEEKTNRIESLAGLLADYESMENKDDENIVAIRLDLLNRMSELYRLTGDFSQALKKQNRVQQLADKFDLKRATAKSLHHCAMIHQARGDYDRALALYGKSLELAEKIGDVSQVSRSYHQIAMVYQDRGDYDRALELYGKLLAIFENLCDYSGVYSSYHQMGMVYQDRGDYDRALKLFGRSLSIADKIGDSRQVSRIYHQIGNVHYQQGDYDRVLDFYGKSLAIAKRIGDNTQICYTYHQIGMVYQALGDYDRALELYEKSLKIKEKLGDISGLGTSYGQMGIVFQSKGDYDRALNYYQKALRTFEKLGKIIGTANSHGQLGLLNFQLERYETAAEYFAKAFAIFQQIGSPNSQLAQQSLIRVQEKIGEEKLQEIVKRVIDELDNLLKTSGEK